MVLNVLMYPAGRVGRACRSGGRTALAVAGGDGRRPRRRNANLAERNWDLSGVAYLGALADGQVLNRHAGVGGVTGDDCDRLGGVVQLLQPLRDLLNTAAPAVASPCDRSIGDIENHVQRFGAVDDRVADGEAALNGILRNGSLVAMLLADKRVELDACNGDRSFCSCHLRHLPCIREGAGHLARRVACGLIHRRCGLLLAGTVALELVVDVHVLHDALADAVAAHSRPRRCGAGYVGLRHDGHIARQSAERIAYLGLARADALGHQVDHVRHIGVEVTQRAFVRFGKAEEALDLAGDAGDCLSDLTDRALDALDNVVDDVSTLLQGLGR